MRLPASWRTLALSLVGACLLVIASLNLASAQPAAHGNRAASAPKLYTPSKRTGKLAGIVDLSKAPKLALSAQTPATIPYSIDPLTPAQRAAYEKNMRAHPQVKNPSPTQRSGDGLSPRFVGGGVNPLLGKNFDGLTSAQSGGNVNPDPAIATDMSYVMEGVNNAVGIYRASTGALAYGPYAASSFFAPVYSSGDTFSNPQVYYDVMRDRWIVSWLQVHSVAEYIDIAVSVSNSPTQPAPGGQYYIYQVSTTSDPFLSFCPPLTMGVDYWGLYFTCQNHDDSGAGNEMLALSKAPMLSGGDFVLYAVDNGLQTATGHPALATSPAIEEGAQDAEFFVSTDEGVDAVSSNMGLCAWTNLSNITTTPPTVTCQNVDLGLPYAAPFYARQPSGPTLYPAYSPQQVYYKAGRLYVAQSTALGGNHDGIYWAEVKPQLTTKAAFNPQHVNGAEVTQVNYFDYGPNYDLYDPTLMGTDENDISLIYTVSGPTLNPRVELVGRKATDAPGMLAQGSGTFVLVANGAHTASDSRWGYYSSCAISLNSVTRGTIWCGSEYPGSVAAPGWNTRLFSFRTE
jgi:hypothetical protein